jgi:squalene-associated FAD-dependent desaturase
MPSALVIGGGLSGLAAAAALGGAGFDVDLYEARGFLGGRATSYPIGDSDSAETIDNCQHILLRCCVNLLDFYERLGARERIRFHRDFTFLEPGGRVSSLRGGRLGSFLRLRFLGLADKIAIARGLLAIKRQRHRDDLDKITMLEWLRENGQTERAIERFWKQVLVSAINEDLDRMAAAHGFQVFWLGFLAKPDAYEMGVPAVPLGDLYRAEAWERIGKVRLHFRSPVERVEIENGAVRGVVAAGELRTADYYVSALPFERVGAVIPGLEFDASQFEHSPITGIHLWFDRPVTDLENATLLDRTVQWMFNKSEGRYVQVVVSASRSLTAMSRGDCIALAVRELGEFFPAVREAKLEKAHVVKEVRATFSARPGLEQLRPQSATGVRNLFLAGDWTRSGWPATMEGAVRSGYLAAEAVTQAAGRPERFLLPDIG